MRKDPTKFRERFQRWKNGEQVYDAGLPYDKGSMDDVVITPDKEYNAFINTLPMNQRMTPESEYTTHRYWELNGKPKTFEEAKSRNMYSLEKDGTWHAKSIQLTPSGDYEWMKPKRHPTAYKELDWYNSKEGSEFRKQYKLVDDVNRPGFYKYQRRIQLPKYSDGKDQDSIGIAVDFLAKNEGFVPNVYRDYAASQRIAKIRGKYDPEKGKYYIPTAGYGWTSKSDLHSWTKESAKERLRQDVIKYDELLQNGPISNYANLNPYQKAAIIDLIHQGGTHVLKKMPKFVEAMNAGDYDKAYTHLAFNTKGTPKRSSTRQSMFSRKYEVQPTTVPAVNKIIPQNDIIRPVAKPLIIPTVTTDEGDKVNRDRIFPEATEVVVTPTRKYNELAEWSTSLPPISEFMEEWMQRNGILTPYQWIKNLKSNKLATTMPK